MVLRTLGFAFVVTVAVAIPPLLAQGITFIQGSEEERAACRPDVHRLCRLAGVDQGRVLACLQEHGDDLSRKCKAVLVKYGKL